jgi:NADPH:quinone reductase-like Zn-dependent oxidoreductase
MSSSRLTKGEIRPVIDRTYALLDDIVDAHRYVDHGHKRAM